MKTALLSLVTTLPLVMPTPKGNISLITIVNSQTQQTNKGNKGNVYLCLTPSQEMITLKRCLQQGDRPSPLNYWMVLSVGEVPLATIPVEKESQNNEKPPTKENYVLLVPFSTRRPKASYMYFHANRSCIKSNTKFTKTMLAKFSSSRKGLITKDQNKMYINGREVFDDFPVVFGFGIDERSEKIILCVIDRSFKVCLAVMSTTNTFEVLFCFPKKKDPRYCREISLDQDNEIIYFVTDTAIYSIPYQGKDLKVLVKEEAVKCLVFYQKGDKLYYTAQETLFMAIANPFELLKRFPCSQELGYFLVFDLYLLMSIERSNKLLVLDVNRLHINETVKVNTGPFVYLLVAVDC